MTDLQILVGSLDCLYQITNSGQLLCSLIMSATTRSLTPENVPSNCPLGVKQLGTNKMIRLLVDFLTLEASSLGPSAVSSIRVVEIRPTTDSHLQKGLYKKICSQNADVKVSHVVVETRSNVKLNQPCSAPLAPRSSANAVSAD